MSAPPPLRCVYEGAGVFRALSPELAAEHYGQGEVVTLTPAEDRSMRSHSHYFAALGEAFNNLPDHLAAQYPSFDHFRKRGLIATGHRDERSIACASKAEAARVAAFMRPMDDFAVVIVSEAVVTAYTAKSQSMRAMGKERFQASKDDVLEWAASQIGVSAQALSRAKAA